MADMSTELRKQALILGTLLILVSVAFTQSVTLAQVTTTIFTDSFESDSASSFPNDGMHVGQCLIVPPNYEGGGNSSSTAVKSPCTPPPLRGTSGGTIYAWGAESNHICLKRGGCVSTSNHGVMGPNSIFSVVTEQAHTGTKSLKLGMSDWRLDETQAFMRLPVSAYPANNTVGASITFNFSVWFSAGIENPDSVNRFTFGLSSNPGGQTFIYVGRGGGCLGNNYCWQWYPPIPAKSVPVCGSGASNFRLIPQTWHTIAVTVNLGPQVVYGNFTIDGVTPPSLSCLIGHPAYIEPNAGQNYYVNNFFVMSSGDNQSEYYHGVTNGWYAYLDDVLVTSTNTSSGTTVTVTRTVTSLQNVTITVTTTAVNSTITVTRT